MIFLDTSAIYALADSADPNHGIARRRFDGVISRGESFLTHNYVLLEATALIQARLGLAVALRFADEARRFETEWVEAHLHAEAVQKLRRHARRKVSLVDQVSFLVMDARKVTVAFAFDPHFEAEGFRLLAG